MENGANPFAVLVSFTSTAELRVSDRNKVVDEVNWADGSAMQPGAVTLIVEAGMTYIEIQSTGAGATAAQPVAQDSTYELAMELVFWSEKNLKQRVGGAFVEDAPKSAMLDDSLSLTREVLQIGDTNTIDPRRSTPLPPAPQQTTNVE